jgi:hypothetical protein
MISVILLPALLLAELRQPMFTVSPAGVANLAIGPLIYSHLFSFLIVYDIIPA